jgi:prevent-host-death family protein
MQQVGAFEAKNRLSELLRLAEAGEEIAITNRGRVVARLVPPRPMLDRDQAAAAVGRIRARRKGVTLGGMSVRELIEAGRR